MICSSVKRFFTSNLRRLGDWTPNRRATQNRGDVGRVLGIFVSPSQQLRLREQRAGAQVSAEMRHTSKLPAIRPEVVKYTWLSSVLYGSLEIASTHALRATAIC
jgi:hypothetical protein